MKHRTAIITAASIAVVIAASTAAIATNLGILDSATEASDVGVLTIETVETVPASTALPMTDAPPAKIVVVEDTAASGVADESEGIGTGELAAYAVGDAGIVTLSNDGQMLTVVDVTTNPGWETAQILDGTAVDIGFMSADGGSLQFTAELDEAGGIVTAVNDLSSPATVVVTETVYEDGSSATSGSSGTYDDDDDDHYEDEDEHEDEDEDEDEDD